MSRKTTFNIFRDCIRACKTAPLAKKYTRKYVKLRANWNEFYRLPAMLTALRYKFAIPELRHLLIATGDSYLEETNTWNDQFWGVCDGEGKNMLGKFLMKVRDEVRI